MSKIELEEKVIKEIREALEEREKALVDLIQSIERAMEVSPIVKEQVHEYLDDLYSRLGRVQHAQQTLSEALGD